MILRNAFGVLLALLLLLSCEKAPPAAVTPPAASAPAAAFAVTPTVAAEPKPELTQDLAEFCANEPLPRAAAPTRGTVLLPLQKATVRNMDHWMQYDWTLQPKRWGKYQVKLDYALHHATQGVQVKIQETRLRKILQAAPSGHTVSLGEFAIPAHLQTLELSLYAPSTAEIAGFEVHSLSLVPVAEDAADIQPEADGSVVLSAKRATTWSESLRYEPAKDCLGYWRDAADLAEWGLQLNQSGKYEVILTQGCNNANAGSTVQVEIAGQKMAFTVSDTGGFQQWKEVSLGTVDIAQAGKHYLTVTVQKMAHEAVMDVQKLRLKKVGA